MPAEVSVLLPFYNAGRFLRASIDSVLAQTFQDFELLVIDDGSTDCSPVIAEEAARNDARVRLISLGANSGVVRALNVGLDEAKGKWIARMDADDICREDRLERQLSWLETSKVDVCGTWFSEFGHGLPRKVRWPTSVEAVRAALLFQNALCHPTVMGKRQVFDAHRYRESYRLVEDYDLWSRVSVDFRIANMPECLLRYRRHSRQISTLRRDAMEAVTRQIREDTLRRSGISPNHEQLRSHHMVRDSRSIQTLDDLRRIEEWLLSLSAAHTDADARQVIATQWLRACIRAAPIGRAMLQAWQASPLRPQCGASTLATFDLAVLSLLRLDYRSPLFSAARRFGLSA